MTILLPETYPGLKSGQDCPARTHGRTPAGFEGLCLIFPEVQRFIWHAGVTDLRKSYTGPGRNHQTEIPSRPVFPAVCSHSAIADAHLIKILQWDGSGFWILMKRLDRDAFHWPDTPDELQKVTLKEIHWLCDGLSLNPSGAFEDRHPKIVI